MLYIKLARLPRLYTYEILPQLIHTAQNLMYSFSDLSSPSQLPIPRINDILQLNFHATACKAAHTQRHHQINNCAYTDIV